MTRSHGGGGGGEGVSRNRTRADSISSGSEIIILQGMADHGEGGISGITKTTDVTVTARSGDSAEMRADAW